MASLTRRKRAKCVIQKDQCKNRESSKGELLGKHRTPPSLDLSRTFRYPIAFVCDKPVASGKKENHKSDDGHRLARMSLTDETHAETDSATDAMAAWPLPAEITSMILDAVEDKVPAVFVCRLLRGLLHPRGHGRRRVPWCYASTLVARGQIDLLRWARSMGCPWDTHVCIEAARRGDLDLLSWTASLGCPYTFKTMNAAAKNGHRHVVQLLYDQGMPLSKTCKALAKSGIVDMIDWAASHGEPLRIDPVICGAVF